MFSYFYTIVVPSAAAGVAAAGRAAGRGCRNAARHRRSGGVRGGHAATGSCGGRSWSGRWDRRRIKIKRCDLDLVHGRVQQVAKFR